MTFAALLIAGPSSGAAQFSERAPEGTGEGCYWIPKGFGMLEADLYPIRIELHREPFDFGWHAVGMNEGSARIGPFQREVLAPWRRGKDTIHVVLDFTYPLRPLQRFVTLRVDPLGTGRAVVHQRRLSLVANPASTDRLEDVINVRESREVVPVLGCEKKPD